MKTDAHTPGPWTVEPGVPDGGGIGIGPILEGIGPHAIVTFNGGDSEANARVIALAPEMVEALRAMVAAQSLPFDHAERRDALARARAILAKLEPTP